MYFRISGCWIYGCRENVTFMFRLRAGIWMCMYIEGGHFHSQVFVFPTLRLHDCLNVAFAHANLDDNQISEGGWRRG